MYRVWGMGPAACSRFGGTDYPGGDDTHPFGVMSFALFFLGGVRLRVGVSVQARQP